MHRGFSQGRGIAEDRLRRVGKTPSRLLCSLAASSRLCRMALLTGAALVALGATASVASAQLHVYVGYADTLRANPTHFPTPWAPVVRVYGNTCVKKTCDNGAVRFVNNDKTPVTIKSVAVKLSTCTYRSWPNNLKVGAGKEIILGNEGRKGMTGCSKKIDGFDTSEVGPHGKYWSGNCHQSGIIPQVIVTTSAGSKTFRDTGKVLNTGGVDSAKCPKGSKNNESSQWTPIGSQRCTGAVLSLAPPSQKHGIHTAATVTATLRNSGGRHCGKPLQGAIIKFRTLSGPNKGKTARIVTNTHGKAPYTYTSTRTGTDRLRASTSNPTGSIHSNAVRVIWVKGHHHGGHRAGTFSCQGTGAQILTLTFAVSNAKDSPCRSAHASVLHVSGKKSLAVTAHAVSSSTLLKAGRLPKAGDTAAAKAKVAKASIGAIPGHKISLGVVTSKVKEVCVRSKSGGLKLARAATSRVASITIDGKKTVIGNKPVKIPLGPLATIWLNRTIRTTHSLTQRAVEIDLAGKVLVILAQAQADYSGSPCSST